MNKNRETKEKICSFFTSDYHFEMITLPYISKKIEENKKIIILTENNLENTINKLVSNINLKDIKKKEILKLNWNNNNSSKFEEINDNIQKQKDTIVFVKGKQDYIKNTNKNLEKNKDKNNIKIIDCYDLEEISDKIDEVVSNYSKVLDTKGEKNIH